VVQVVGFIFSSMVRFWSINYYSAHDVAFETLRGAFAVILRFELFFIVALACAQKNCVARFKNRFPA
jgi:hypothetical protein